MLQRNETSLAKPIQSGLNEQFQPPAVPILSLTAWVFPTQEIPELDGALSEAPSPGSENSENDERRESKEKDPEVTGGGKEVSADLDEKTTGLQEGGEENVSSGVADGRAQVTRLGLCTLWLPVGLLFYFLQKEKIQRFCLRTVPSIR